MGLFEVVPSAGTAVVGGVSNTFHSTTPPHTQGHYTTVSLITIDAIVKDGVA